MSSSDQAILQARRQPPIEAVVIGTSAGGLEALGVVLEGLPSTYRPPILVVQHVRPTAGASWWKSSRAEPGCGSRKQKTRIR